MKEISSERTRGPESKNQIEKGVERIHVFHLYSNCQAPDSRLEPDFCDSYPSPSGRRVIRVKNLMGRRNSGVWHGKGRVKWFVLVKDKVVAIDLIEAGVRSLQVGEEPGGVRYGKEIWDVNCGGELIRTMGFLSHLMRKNWKSKKIH